MGAYELTWMLVGVATGSLGTFHLTRFWVEHSRGLFEAKRAYGNRDAYRQ